MVLVHHFRRPLRGQRAHNCYLHNVLLAWIAILALCGQFARAQAVVHGQTYTQGLAILDSPQTDRYVSCYSWPHRSGAQCICSTLEVGSTISLAIETTGNGVLPVDASLPNSTQPTHMTLLEVYLISQQTSTNLTICAGIGLLANESGSVKHAQLVLPSCVAPGAYNVCSSFVLCFTRY
jgi:hypothetical protein